jgi:TolA-binding protein
LYKAAVLAIELGQKSKAKSYIEEIKSKYPDSAEGQYAEALVAMLGA